MGEEEEKKERGETEAEKWEKWEIKTKVQALRGHG